MPPGRTRGSSLGSTGSADNRLKKPTAHFPVSRPSFRMAPGLVASWMVRVSDDRQLVPSGSEPSNARRSEVLGLGHRRAARPVDCTSIGAGRGSGDSCSAPTKAPDGAVPKPPNPPPHPSCPAATRAGGDVTQDRDVPDRVRQRHRRDRRSGSSTYGAIAVGIELASSGPPEHVGSDTTTHYAGFVPATVTVILCPDARRVRSHTAAEVSAGDLRCPTASTVYRLPTWQGVKGRIGVASDVAGAPTVATFGRRSTADHRLTQQGTAWTIEAFPSSGNVLNVTCYRATG